MELEFLKSRLEAYLAAERAILTGQEYVIGDRRLRRADLAEIRAVIDDLLTEINLLETKNGRIKRVVFID